MRSYFLPILLVFALNALGQTELSLSFAQKQSSSGYGGNLVVSESTKDIDGNVYLIGNFRNLADFDPSANEVNVTALDSPNEDMFIAKYNASGGFVWVKTIAATGSVSCTGVVVGGNFLYLIGKYTNTVDFDPSANTSTLTSANGSYEAGFLAKYDLNGTYITSKSIDGEPGLTLDSISFFNNQLVVSGNFKGIVDFDPSPATLNLSSNGDSDSFVVKYSTLFLPVWGFNIGSTSIDYAINSTVNSAGEIVISGRFIGAVDFDPSASDFIVNNPEVPPAGIYHTYLAKYSAAGSLIFAYDIGGRSYSPYDVKLAVDSSNNIIVAGKFDAISDFDPSPVTANLSGSSSPLFIAKYNNNNGGYLWARRITGCTANDVTINTANNTINLAGSFNASSDFDLGAGTYNLDTANGTTFFASYGPNAEFVYATNLKSTVSRVLSNGSEGILLTGWFSGIVDFDTSPNEATLTSSYRNGFMAKYDTAANYISAKAVGGNKPVNAITNFVSTDNAGNIYRAGSLSALTDLDPSSGTFNVSSTVSQGIYIAKYTSGGSFVWGQSVPGSTGTALGISVMGTDPSGNTYVFGTVNTNNVNSMYMLKYDTNGNNVWTKQIEGSLGVSRRVLFDAAGNFYLAGRMSGTDPIDFNPSPFGSFLLTPVGIESFIAKYSPQGDLIWAKKIAAEGSDSQQNETDFQIHGANLYVTGFFVGTIIFDPATNQPFEAVNGINGFIAKYDLDGNHQFSGVYIGNDTTGASCPSYSVAVDAGGNFYVTTGIQGGTIDFDLSPDAEYAVSSPVDANLSLLNTYVVAKYSPSGTFLWAKPINAVDEFSGLYARRIHTFLNSDNELLMISQIGGSMDFDPSDNGTFIVSTPVQQDGNPIYKIFAATYNSSTGGLIGVNTVDSDRPSELYSVSVNNNTEVLISGAFVGSADFDLTAGVQTLVSNSENNYDMFWAKYTAETLDVTDAETVANYRVYPNPATGDIFVSHPTSQHFEFSITDTTGKLLKAGETSSQSAIDVSSLPQGVYFIKISTESESCTLRMVKK